MDGGPADRPSWYRALTVRERAAMLQARPSAATDVALHPDQAERLRRWRLQLPFEDDAVFARRLAVDGLDETSFRRLLGETSELLREGCRVRPAWCTELAAAFTSTGVNPPETPAPDIEQGELLIAIAPLIESGRQRLRARLASLSVPAGIAPDLNELETVLFASLPEHLLALVARTLVLELNVARVRGQLVGETPEARYRSFVDRLADPETALAILDEYPVLARRAVARIDRWVETSSELIARLVADWPAIRERFAHGQQPDRLVEVTVRAGDSHRGGRSVSLLRFGDGFRLVYKPKPLAVDAHFQELLAWLNRRGDHLPFRTTTVLDRGDYGWVELVAAAACRSTDEARRFYERQGGYLALFYALAATDFHFENVIAAGEHPLMLDLEALFHPEIEAPEIEGKGGERSDGLAANAMGDSVMAAGLLPERRWESADADGVDVSGLGASGGQPSPRGIPSWEAAGTDVAHYRLKPAFLPSGQNRPTLDGEQTTPLDFVEAIVDGFDRVYRALQAHRDELLAEGGPLAWFAEDEVRIIARPTRTYDLLLSAASHPDLLRDGLDLDRHLDRLWVGIPRLERLIPAEHRDLEDGDVPVFTTRPGSRDIWTSRGERLAELLDRPGLAEAHRRLRRLGEADLERQRWFVRASLATLSNGAERPRGRVRHRDSDGPAPDSDQLLAAASGIGDRLAALAIRGDDGGASWIGLSLSSRGHWSLRPLWFDLYDGLPGVAVFLAYLGNQTGEWRFEELARGATITWRRGLERAAESVTEIGGFTGWGGMLYALTHLATLWHDQELLDDADQIVARLPDLISRDEALDVIGGAAGCVGGLAALYRATRSETALAAAVRCGERLVNRAQVVPSGLGWSTPQTEGWMLTGFSHGAAGIAWALLQIDDLIGEPRFRSTALAAIDYERSLFSPEARNWPDLRSGTTDRPSFMTAWCHGAPGIGLARLSTRQSIDDSTTHDEIVAVLETTSASRPGADHSLCHGTLGNLEPLLEAGRVLAPAWTARAIRMARVILDDAERSGWQCGTPLGVESPGLMTGLAGIGYGLLRLAMPDDLPSVLSMEPPRRSWSPACPPRGRADLESSATRV